MSYSYTINNVEDASLQSSYNGITTTYQAVRVVTVGNLDDGSSSAGATMLARALVFVQQKFPAYTPYGGGIANCVVMGHQVIPVVQDDQTVRVRIIYGTPDVNHTSIFVVSDNTTTQCDTTQIYRDDVEGVMQQLLVKYQDPANPKIFKQYTGSTRYDRTLRTTCLDVILPKARMPAFRSIVNYVNDKKFNGLPRGFWRVSEFSSTTEDLGITYKMQVQISADLSRDWSSYDILRDRNTGLTVTIPPATLAKIQSRTYTPGVISENGIIRVGNYQLADFPSFFGNLQT